MNRDENEFYDNLEEEQEEHDHESLWRNHRGRTIDPGQPLNGIF